MKSVNGSNERKKAARVLNDNVEGEASFGMREVLPIITSEYLCDLDAWTLIGTTLFCCGVVAVCTPLSLVDVVVALVCLRS